MKSNPFSTLALPILLLRCAPLVAVLACMPSHAQYKVVGPDGKVTYTDRAPGGNDGKVTSLGARAPAPVLEVA